jgi:hypothetical protein
MFSLLAVVALGFVFKANAQMDATMDLCSKNIVPPFISDGQQYKALLSGEEIAEFRATFYGGSTYRISACSGQSEGNIVFSLYDKERNLLYSSKDYENSPYWDFKFTSTIDCIIEAELVGGQASGFAFMLIGFKQL